MFLDGQFLDSFIPKNERIAVKKRTEMQIGCFFSISKICEWSIAAYSTNQKVKEKRKIHTNTFSTLFIYLFIFLSWSSGNLHPFASSAVSVVAKPQLMLLMWALLKYEFNMKVGRASLHSIVMPHKQWGADTGNVIGKMSGQIDRFSVNCYVIRSVINPSETTACSPPDRPTSGEVYTPNADTVHIMLMWFCPSSEIYYICTEDAVALAVKLLLHDV